MRMFPPQTCEVLEVLLEDGTVARALWTGSKWWRGQTTVEPRAWRQPETETLAKVA